MTDVVAVITGKKRDAVHELLIEHLGGLGDVRLAIDHGDIETARRLAREFAEDFRLLDDIGWGRDERIAVPLTIPPGELTAIFNRLRGDAQSALAESEDERETDEVATPAPVAARLRDHLAAQPDQDSTALAFPNEAGGSLDPGNLRRRVLKPLAAEAGAPWAGFHTFRHTFASLHLAHGTNLLQLSRALGHHSPAFTLTRYTHLLSGDEAPALDL